MDKDFLAIFNAIKADGANTDYTKRGIDPLYSVGAGARIVIIGQAPGSVAEETRIPWNDKSGEGDTKGNCLKSKRQILQMYIYLLSI